MGILRGTCCWRKITNSGSFWQISGLKYKLQDHEGSVMAQKWRPCQVWTDMFTGTSVRRRSLSVVFLWWHLNFVFLITSYRKLSIVFPQLVEAKALSLAPHSQLWRCSHVPCSLREEQRLPVQFTSLKAFSSF